MKKILMVMFLAMASVGAAPKAMFADAISDQVVANLRSQGYTVREMQRTWLGRMWVLADNGTVQREVVFNPGTGEILRDYAVLIASLPQAPAVGSEKTAAVERDHSDNSQTRLSASASATVPGADMGLGMVTGQSSGERQSGPVEVTVEPVNPLQ